MKINHVSAGGGYDIRIERGCLAACGAAVRAVCGGSMAMLIADASTHELYAAQVTDSLSAAGYAVRQAVIPPGEGSKSGEMYLQLLELCAEEGLTRSDVIVALGGGVVGDLAGFVAATYLRGVKLVQAPTTLLAMLDASVGGKTAIDLEMGKNLAGAFYHPALVLCDPAALDSLPPYVLADGLGEAIKYGMIREPSMLTTLHPGTDPEPVIACCTAIKRDLVEADESDHGERQFLNFGHTIGHAIEALSGYAIGHGHAVAAGMAIITRAAEAQGDCEPGTAALLTDALTRCGLPIGTDDTAEQLAAMMQRDKKRSGAEITLIVPRRAGLCERKTMPMAALADYIRPGL